MPRSIETIVAAHDIATERRAKGKSPWDRKLRVGDIFHDDDMPIEDKVTEIVRRIRAQIQPHFPDDEDLEMLVDEMEWVVDQFREFGSGKPRHDGPLSPGQRDRVGDDFDAVWDGFYDWCDLVGRVWVETF